VDAIKATTTVMKIINRIQDNYKTKLRVFYGMSMLANFKFLHSEIDSLHEIKELLLNGQSLRDNQREYEGSIVQTVIEGHSQLQSMILNCK
jgi:hypothetical protein